MWRVSVDGLPLTLVELDGTAVQPLDVSEPHTPEPEAFPTGL